MTQEAKNIKDFLEQGYRILWPIRIVSIENKGRVFIQIFSNGCVEELDVSEKENFKEKHSQYYEQQEKDLVHFAVLEKDGDKILTYGEKDFGRDLSQALSKRADFGKEAIRLIKHCLDEVHVCHDDDDSQFKKLKALIRVDHTAIYKEVIKKRLKKDKIIELVHIYSGTEVTINEDKIVFKLANDLFNQKDSLSKQCKEELLIIVENFGKGSSELLGFVFREPEYIKKVEAMYGQIDRQEIEFRVRASSNSITQGIDVVSVVDRLPKIGEFVIQKGYFADEILVKIVEGLPSEIDDKLVDQYKEKVAFSLDLLAFELGDVGFTIVGRAKINKYTDGVAKARFGPEIYMPKPNPNSKSILEKRMNVEQEEICKCALEGLNKAKNELFAGSALKTLWATIEGVFFEEQTEGFFTKEEKDEAGQAINRVSDKERGDKAKEVLGYWRQKTRNEVIKENIYQLFPTRDKKEIDLVIRKASRLRGKDVHELIEETSEVNEVNRALEEYIIKYVNKHLGEGADS